MPPPADSNNNVVSEGWAAVGGHAAVIQQLKEMVLLPLQYPEVFKHMGITPPRGILFYGSPGIVRCRGSLTNQTGKSNGQVMRSGPLGKMSFSLILWISMLTCDVTMLQSSPLRALCPRLLPRADPREVQLVPCTGENEIHEDVHCG